jgi:hypothetical protein
MDTAQCSWWGRIVRVVPFDAVSVELGRLWPHVLGSRGRNCDKTGR